MMLMVMKIEPINSVEEARGDYNSRGGAHLINLLCLHQRELGVLQNHLVFFYISEFSVSDAERVNARGAGGEI